MRFLVKNTIEHEMYIKNYMDGEPKSENTGEIFFSFGLDCIDLIFRN